MARNGGLVDGLAVGLVGDAISGVCMRLS